MKLIEGRTLEFIETPGGNAGVGVATPSHGAAEVSVIRQRQQPGGANPLHSHDREEVMVVLAGAVAVTVDCERRIASAGDALIIPADTLHMVENVGEDTAEWLLVAPAGVRFLHASGDAANPPWAA